jgi:hypothetical protein
MRHATPVPGPYKDLIIGIIALVLAMMYWAIIIAPMFQQQFRNVQLF